MKIILILLLLISCAYQPIANAQRPLAPVLTEEEAEANKLSKVTNNVVDFIINRINMVSLESHIQSMQKNGITNKKFVAGFSTDGALLYMGDFEKTNLKSLMEIGGRKSGMQLLSFDLRMLENGTYHYSISLASYRNGYEMNSNHELEIGGISKYIDRVDFITATRDHRLSYSNIDSYQFRMIDVDFVFPIMSKKSFLGAIAGVGLGNYGHLEITDINKYGYDNDVETGFTKNFLGVGTSLNLEGGGGFRVGMKYLWKNQTAGRRLEVRSIYEQSDANLILLKPDAAKSWGYEAQTFNLQRNYLRGTLDYSVLSKRSVRPTRIGVAFQFNIPIKDQLVSAHQYDWDPPAQKLIDFKQNVNRVNLKIYVKF